MLLEGDNKAIIRTAEPADTGKLLEYIQQILSESEYMLVTPSEFNKTESRERERISQHQKSQNCLQILAEIDGEIIGMLRFTAPRLLKLAHQGRLAMSVCRRWQGKGIGTALLMTLVAWAEANPLVEKICLAVFCSNT